MKILIIDEHRLFAEGLCQLFKSVAEPVRPADNLAHNPANDPAYDLEYCCSCKDARLLPYPHKTELILLGYYRPGLDGQDALSMLRERFLDARIVILSSLKDSRLIRQLIDAGAAGFVSKTSTFADLLSALKVVMAGGVYIPAHLNTEAESESVDLSLTGSESKNRNIDSLSQRQHEVLMQVVQGKSNKGIANELGISEHTVKAHVSASFKLLGVKNRTEAAVQLHRKLRPVPSD